MGTWQVDGRSRPGILYLVLEGRLDVGEMTAFCAAHNAAVDAFGDADYRVFCDVRALAPLAPACAALLEAAKRHSADRANFRGSSVWVSSAVVALQHQRTSERSGVMSTELISDDEAQLWQHLSTVARTSSGPPRPLLAASRKP